MTALKLLITTSLLFISATFAEAQIVPLTKTGCAQTLPAGLVIRVEPDEKIVAGKTDGPLLLTVTSDVRLFPSKPPIVPRSSKLFARTIESKEAGRLWGRARYQMTVEGILTPDGCQYSIDAKLIEAGKYKVQKEHIVGQGHAARDFMLWLFPPTTFYQLIRLPGRGPKLLLDEESTLAIRLFQPVRLQEPEANLMSNGGTPVATSDALTKPSNPLVVSECSGKPQPDLHNPIQLGNAVIRPFRNMTPYAVTLAIGRETVSHLGPCFASMVSIPVGQFDITAKAVVLEAGGQREIPLEIVVNSAGTGWDVINHESAVMTKAVAARVQQN